MSSIAGTTVLVTGAASGIGRLTSLAMARRGARVVAWDLDRTGLERLLPELRAAGGSGHAVYGCDVSDRREVYRVADRVRAECGRVEVLVNNAGVVSGRRFLEVPDEKIERTLAVNTLALFWTTKAFLPAMVEQNRGHLVTIASASGLVGVSGLADYAASKWAAVGFDESLRMELARAAPGVKTTVVCPYYIDTGMFAGVRTRVPWLLPILKERQVAERIARAVERNERRLFMPWSVYLLPVFRALPARLFDRAMDLLGVNSSMDHFRGREGSAGSPAALRSGPDRAAR